jgi:riboflavin synthase
MFTGIIETLGEIVAIQEGSESRTFSVRPYKAWTDLMPGESINIDGACQTLKTHGSGVFHFDSVAETLRRTNLGMKKAGDIVNLERALLPTTRLGGHFVLGHVDGTGEIISARTEGVSTIMTVSVERELADEIVGKGSIAINGISLTVAGVNETDFSVALVPFTLENTTLERKKIGEIVNIETDILGKYILKLAGLKKEKDISWNLLNDSGFLD